MFTGPGTSIPPNEFEARMVEYVKLLNKELRTTSTPPNHRQSKDINVYSDVVIY